jgi:hypothetical protein
VFDYFATNNPEGDFAGGGPFSRRKLGRLMFPIHRTMLGMIAARNHWSKVAAMLAMLLVLLRGSANAQSFQFLPEVDVYHKISKDIRFEFQAKRTREAGDPTQAEIGPSLDFYVKPLLRLKDTSPFDLDDSKSRTLHFSVGYRYVPSVGKPPTERLELVGTFNFSLVAGILFSDRNRGDLDWSNGRFTWRYRNRVTLERRIAIGSYHPTPYVSAEPYYLSQYGKWSTTALNVGCLFPIGKHVVLDPYYEHQNNTGKHPNEQLNQFGLILNLHL